jgi:hypothetical protein
VAAHSRKAQEPRHQAANAGFRVAGGNHRVLTPVARVIRPRRVILVLKCARVAPCNRGINGTRYRWESSVQRGRRRRHGPGCGGDRPCSTPRRRTAQGEPEAFAAGGADLGYRHGACSPARRPRALVAPYRHRTARCRRRGRHPAGWSEYPLAVAGGGVDADRGVGGAALGLSRSSSGRGPSRPATGPVGPGSIECPGPTRGRLRFSNPAIGG